MSKLLTRSAILEADDIASEIVPIPEWKGEVRVKGLSSTERDAFELSMLENPGTKKQKPRLDNIRAKLAALTVVDEEGKPLFTQRDIELLGKKNGGALDRIYSAAQRLSKISDADVEELAGN